MVLLWLVHRKAWTHQYIRMYIQSFYVSCILRVCGVWAAAVIYMAVDLQREEERTPGSGGWKGLLLLFSNTECKKQPCYESSRYTLIPHTVIYCNPNPNTCRKQSSCAHPQAMYTNEHCMHALKWSAHARTHALLHTSLQTHSNSYILSGRNVHGHIIVYPGCIKIHTIRTYSIQMCTNKDGDSIYRRPPSHSTDHLWSAVNVPLQYNQHTLHDHTGVACKPVVPEGASNKTMYSIVMFTHVRT